MAKSNKELVERDPLVVLLLGIFTCGIYSWYWLVKTKGELNRSGADHIPTAWIWLIPIVGGIWWNWKYAQGAAKVAGKYSDALIFLLIWLLGPIGHAIMQDAYNNAIKSKSES